MPSQKDYNGNYTDSNIFTDLKSNAAFYKKLLGMDEQYLKNRNKLSEKYNLDRLKKELKYARNNAKEREKLEKQLSDTVEKIEQEAVVITQKAWENTYKKSTLAKKAELLKQKQESVKAALEEAEVEREIIQTTNIFSAAEKRKALDENKKLIDNFNKELANNEKTKAKVERENNLSQLKDIQKARKDGIKGIAKFSLSQDKETRKAASKAAQEQNMKDLKAKKEAADKVKRLQEQYASRKASGEPVNDQWYQSRIANAQKTYDNAAADAKESSVANALSQVADNLATLGSHMMGAILASQKRADDMMANYQSKVNASLQGSNKNFQNALEMVEKNLAFSPIVKMEDVITNIKEAADQGIVYNLEQRAFLNTVSDKIAHTFDAFDSNLTRLIKLQQADSTAARLGMEASLTKLLNSNFNDSSYLKSAFDDVSKSLIDANSQMTKEQSAAFEFTVQKWLGALYSLGLSEGTVNQIAQGINYMATGDVTNLASNTQLQTLMAMSASAAGLDYAQIMLDGLDASSTNKLLQGMVGYLKTIAENSENQVVKSAYGDVFNLSLSDMKAISNMTSGDISTIASQSMTYGSMQAETSAQLLQTIIRSSMSETLNNVMENISYGMGMDLAQNPAMWAMGKMYDFMDSSGIDINIPFINAMGFGVDLNASVLDLLKMGLGIGSAMSLASNILGSLGSGGGTGLSLDAWGGTEVNQRGSVLGGLLGTMLGGTSSSVGGSIGNSSSEDMQMSAISDATDDAEKTKKITNKNAQPDDHTLDDFWNATIGTSATDFVRVRDEVLEWSYDSGNSSIRVFDKSLFGAYVNTFGMGALTQSGRVKTLDYGIEAVRSGNVLNVSDKSSANMLNRFSFASGNSLKVMVTGGSMRTEISNADDIGKQVSNNTPKTVALANTTVSLNYDELTKAIISALSTNSKDGIKLKEYLEAVMKGNTVSVPVSAQPGQPLDVKIKSVEPGLKFNK